MVFNPIIVEERRKGEKKNDKLSFRVIQDFSLRRRGIIIRSFELSFRPGDWQMPAARKSTRVTINLTKTDSHAATPPQSPESDAPFFLSLCFVLCTPERNQIHPPPKTRCVVVVLESFCRVFDDWSAPGERDSFVPSSWSGRRNRAGRAVRQAPGTYPARSA